MTVHRVDPLPTNEIDIDISKKAGKETGFSYIECKDYGVLVTEIVRFISKLIIIICSFIQNIMFICIGCRYSNRF